MRSSTRPIGRAAACPRYYRDASHRHLDLPWAAGLSCAGRVQVSVSRCPTDGRVVVGAPAGDDRDRDRGIYVRSFGHRLHVRARSRSWVVPHAPSPGGCEAVPVAGNAGSPHYRDSVRARPAGPPDHPERRDGCRAVASLDRVRSPVAGGLDRSAGTTTTSPLVPLSTAFRSVHSR